MPWIWQTSVMTPHPWQVIVAMYQLHVCNSPSLPCVHLWHLTCCKWNVTMCEFFQFNLLSMQNWVVFAEALDPCKLLYWNKLCHIRT